MSFNEKTTTPSTHCNDDTDAQMHVNAQQQWRRPVVWEWHCSKQFWEIVVQRHFTETLWLKHIFGLLHFYFNISGPKHVFVQTDFAMLMGSSREQQISFLVNTSESLLSLFTVCTVYCSESWGCWFRCIMNRLRCHSW